MRRTAAVVATVVAALLGEWLGHSLAYLRAGGLPGLGAGLISGVHIYMLPVGVALLLAAIIGAALWTRLWSELGVRLDRARRNLSAAWRGHAPEPRAVASEMSGRARFTATAITLVVIQCVLYLMQENIESAASGRGIGIAPLTAGHGAGACAEVVTAVLMAGLLLLARRLLGARRHAVIALEHLVAALSRRLARLGPTPRPRRRFAAPPQSLLGWERWIRPPPGNSAS